MNTFGASSIPSSLIVNSVVAVFRILPLPFRHPVLPNNRALTQLPISCDTRDCGIWLQNACIHTSAPNTLSFYYTTLATCLTAPLRRDTAAFT
jgi:hypothetical protein